MPEADALDVILRLQGLRSFVAGTREAAAGVRGVGRATEESSLASRKASAAQGHQVGVLGLLRKASLGVGGALALAGVEGVKMSVRFGQQMEMIHTQAGASQGEVTKLKGAVLDLGKSTPQGPMELAKGLFHLESIGLRGAKAMDALKIASQGAAVGNAKLEDVTTALGSAWLVNIKGSGDLHQTMAVLNATVGAGNMRMQQLVEALGTGLLPAAKNAGLGLKDTMGALAVFTDEGYQASSAAAQFSTALHFFTNPGKKATDTLKSIHLGQNTLATDMRKPQGLLVAMRDLQTHLKGLSATQRGKVLGDILPGGRGRIFLTLLNQLDRYQQKMGQIGKTSGQFGEAVKRTQETAAFKIHTAWSRVQVALIRFGDMLGKYVVPIIARVLQAGAKLLVWLSGLPGRIAAVVHWWKALPGPLKLLVSIIASMVGSAAIMFGLLRAFTALRTGILAVRSAASFFFVFMRAAPMLLGPVGIAIFAIIAVLLLMVTHWKQTKAVLAAVWHWMVGAFHAVVKVLAAAAKWYIGVLKAVWTPIFNILTFPIRLAAKLLGVSWHTIGRGATDAMNWIKRAFTNVVSWLGGVIGKFASIATSIYRAFTGAFSGLGGFIGGVFKGAINIAVDAVNFLIQQLNSLSDFIKSASNVQVAGVSLSSGGVDLGHIGQIPHMALGGTVTHSGTVMVGERGPELLHLPPGAQVQPLDRTDGQAITVHTHVHLDKRKIAEAIGSYTADRLARA